MQLGEEKNVLRHRGIKLVLVSGTLFIAGLIITIFGPSMQFIIDEYNIGMDVASLFITCYALGRFSTVLISGHASDKIGGKPIITLGAVLMIIGCLGFALIRDYRLGFAAVLAAGMGYGIVDSSSVVLIKKLYPDKEGALSFGTMFYGIGCLIAPIIAGAILNRGQSWRVVFIIAAILGSPVCVGLMISKFNFVSTEEKDNERVGVKNGQKMISPIILLLAGMLLTYTGVGYGLTAWYNIYLRDILNFSIISAATTLTVYNAGIIGGRFICSHLTEKFGTARILLYTSGMAFMSILILILSKSATVSMVFIGLTGFFLAGIFPTAITHAGKLYPAYIGKISGVLISFASLGGIIVPYIMGSIAEGWGISVGIKVVAILGGFLILLAIGVQKISSIAPNKV